MVLLFLVFTSTAISAVDLTTELKKLNKLSESERHSCAKLELELKNIDALDHNANSNGPSFKSRERALKAIDILVKNDLGPSQNTLKAYKLLAEEKEWPNDNNFLSELSKINPECALFNKHDIFWAYSLNHEAQDFSEADKKLFKEQFKKYFESGLSAPGPFLSLVIRADDLFHFNKAKLIGSPADLTNIESLKNKMEQQMQEHRDNLKASQSVSWSIKKEFELSQAYMVKLKAVYNKMK